MLLGRDLAALLGIAIGPGLWTPGAPPRPLPATVAPHKVAITCEDIGLITPDAAALAETLSRLPRGGALTCISRLAITVANFVQPNDQAQQLRLASMFFSTGVVECFQGIMSRDPSRGIFHRLQLLTLMRFLLSLPNEQPASHLTNDDARALGLVALAVNGHLEKDIIKRLGEAMRFAQFPLIWDLIMSEIGRRGLLGAKERARLQVWDLDEFESLLATVERAGREGFRDLGEFLDTKTSDTRARFMPLQNYLAARGVPWEIPTMIRHAFERVWHRAEPIMSKALAAARREQDVY
jgi:hypothetical protein